MPAPNASQFDGVNTSFDWASGSVPPADGSHPLAYSTAEIASARNNETPLLDAITKIRRGAADIVDAMNELQDGLNDIKALGMTNHSSLPPFPLEGAHAVIKLSDLDAGMTILPLVIQIMTNPIASIPSGIPGSGVAPLDLARRIKSAT